MIFHIPTRGEAIAKIPLFIRICPKMRPRKGRSGNMYSPKANQMEIINELSKFDKLMIRQPVIVDCYIFYEHPGTGQDFPFHKDYGDVDNLQKSILDAMVKNQILQDDRWVIGGETFKHFDIEDYVAIIIWSVSDEYCRVAI